MVVFFGKYWRSHRFVFSFVTRCHGVYGARKVPAELQRKDREIARCTAER